MGCITSKNVVKESSQNETQSIQMHTEYDIQVIKMKRLIKSLEEKILQVNLLNQKLLKDCKQLIKSDNVEEAKTLLQLKQIYQTQLKSFVSSKQQILNLLNQFKIANITKLTTEQLHEISQLITPEILEQQNLKLQELIQLSSQTEQKQNYIDQLYSQLNDCNVDQEMENLKKEMGLVDSQVDLQDVQVPQPVKQEYQHEVDEIQICQV